MTIMGEPLRYMVNGAQLPGFVGKSVAICGLVDKAAPGTRSFALHSTDNIQVPVNLDRPLSEPLSGYVEVLGTVAHGGKQIQGESFRMFTNEKFDAKNHNTLCKLMNSIPII